jgi:histidinol-phosphate aminotransferase
MPQPALIIGQLRFEIPRMRMNTDTSPAAATSSTRRQLLRAGSLTLSGLALPSVDAPHATAATAASTASDHIRLSLNESPFGPSPLAVQAIQDTLSAIARYPGEDVRALELQIAARENVSSDQIIVGEILDGLGLQLALEGGPGGEFVYSEPGYTALVDAVAPGGGVVVGVPLNAALENDLPALAARVNDRTRSLYVVNPHNPTGTVSEPVAFKTFLRDISKRTTVIVDEAYLE